MPRLSPLVLAVSLLALTGCPEGGPTTPAAPNAPVGAPTNPDGSPVDFRKLAEDQDARFTDVAVGADGTVHTVYQAPHPRSLKPHVYYRRSTDNGATWSEPLDLMDEDTTTQAGFIRLAIDGQNRVYAFWKTYKGFDLVDPSGGGEGNLAYRALVGGQWTPTAAVGMAERVVSWFPAVAPDGTLHVVWSEVLPAPNNFLAPYWEAGLVRQASLAGGTVGAATDVLQSPAIRLGESSVVHHHGYRGLRGYVDATGRAHFTALKSVADPANGSKPDPVSVIHWDGAQETTLLPVARLEAVLKSQISNPPALFLDAQGQEHLMVLNQYLDRPAVQDYSPPTSQTPTAVYQLQSAKGDIRGAQLSVGAGGKAALTLAMHDTARADTKHDLWVAAFDGRRWAPTVNLTDNAGREAFASKATSANTTFSRLSTYSAGWGAAAFDATGRLNVAFVNTEIQSIMRETSTSAGTGGAFGSSSTTNVYFHRL